MDELLPGIDLEMLFEIGAGFRKVRVENFQEIEREFAGVHVGLEIDSVCGRHGVDPCECGIGGVVNECVAGSDGSSLPL